MGYILERGDLCFHSTLRGLVRTPRELDLSRAYLLAILIATPLVYAFMGLGWIDPWINNDTRKISGIPSCHKISDAGGHPLAGVRLVCYNEWHRYPVVASKGGGEYDVPILQAEAIWYLVVLDEEDQPISAEAPVNFNPLDACWYRLDWQRVD